MIKSIIFDMDGVLLDSEPAMKKSALLALAEYGVTAKYEDFIPFTGAGEDRFVGGVAELHGVPYKKEMKARAYEIYGEIADTDLIIFDGIPEMIKTLHDMGYTMAIASAADEVKVKINIKAIGIDPSCISALVVGEMVTNKKPAPDAFLLAAEKIGTDPENCVVIEDAVNGILAAKNAGMKSIGITSTFSENELKNAGADFAVDATPEIIKIISEKL